jgi:hypothetical protein
MAVLVLSAGMFSPAHAQWTITTYLHPVGNPPIASMRLADQYFTGVKPQRFTGTSAVAIVDLWDGVEFSGQFQINHPFPGLDNVPGPINTDQFVARVTGALAVNTPGPYDFSTLFSTNRFRLDLNQNGTFEETETIAPTIIPGDSIPRPQYRSNILTLAAGSYPFEISFYDGVGGASLEPVYRPNGAGTVFLLGDPSGGIGLTGAATVHTVGAAVTDPRPGLIIHSFAQADALRTAPNEPGFPISEAREVFNIINTFDSGPVGPPGQQGAPGFGFPHLSDDDNFLVVGRGMLVVPAGGISNAIFRSITDDGGRLLIDTNQDGDLTDPADVIIIDDELSPPHEVFSSPVSLAEGRYLIEYSFFEGLGQAIGSVSVNIGGSFTLLGDDAAVAAGFGLDVVIPEPSSVLLAGLAALGIIVRFRKTWFQRRRSRTQLFS